MIEHTRSDVTLPSAGLGGGLLLLLRHGAGDGLLAGLLVGGRLASGALAGNGGSLSGLGCHF